MKVLIFNSVMSIAPLIDNHGRTLSYLRIAVTDRCNLRCFYCMPEQGIQYLPKKELLTFEEIERLVSVLAGAGISKVRITGGEPFVRTDLMDLMQQIVQVPGIRTLHLTTNGVLTGPHVPRLLAMGLASVNLSMDTLNRDRFRLITRRDEFNQVQDTYRLLLESGIPLKVNAVVMDGKNIDDIPLLVELTRHHAVEVRFIEEMPFNGEGSHYVRLDWTYKKIQAHIESLFGSLERVPDPDSATATRFRVPGFKGIIGIIAAFSRTFCGACNRLRITPRGELKTCLYDDGVLNLRTLMRDGCTDEELLAQIRHAVSHRHANGVEAEQHRRNHERVAESMSTIGG